MSTQNRIKVWDPVVRAFHWLLVSAFVTAYLTEDDFLGLHTFAGYTVLGLIGLRLVWGLIGPRYARFSSFVTSPRTAWQYVKDVLLLRAKRHLGHNPAGGAMIVLMLVSLLLTTLTGLAAYGAAESAGPLAGWLGNLGEFGEGVVKGVHEFFANVTVALVVIHVAGVLFESLVHRENLVRAMWTGYKQVDRQTTPE